jgi:hypothetical protein
MEVSSWVCQPDPQMCCNFMWSGQELCSNLMICEFLLAESGLKFSFDVKTTLNNSDNTFYPSQTTHGYDLYASAMEKEDILFLNLLTGKQTDT